MSFPRSECPRPAPWDPPGAVPRHDRVRRRQEALWVDDLVARGSDATLGEVGARCVAAVARGVRAVFGPRASRQAVADCTDRALAAVFEGLGSWTRSGPLEGWCRAVGRNVALDHLRRRQRTRETAVSQLGEGERRACWDEVAAREAGPAVFELLEGLTRAVDGDRRALGALGLLLEGCTGEAELRARGSSRHLQRVGLARLWRGLERQGFGADEVVEGLRRLGREQWRAVMRAVG